MAIIQYFMPRWGGVGAVTLSDYDVPALEVAQSVLGRPEADHHYVLGEVDLDICCSLPDIATSHMEVQASVEVLISILLEYQDFCYMDHRLEHWPYDCPIDFLDNACLPFGPIYGPLTLQLPNRPP